MNFSIFLGISLIFVCRFGKIEAQMCKINGYKCIFKSIKLKENQVLKNLSPNNGIQEVDFDESTLHSVPSEIFSLSKNIEKVWLDNQKMKIIGENKFTNAGSLKNLQLYQNDIQTLKSNSFSGCKSLIELNVGVNQLKMIEEGALNGIASLEILNLGTNKIVEISGKLFEPLVNLKKIFLDTNKIEFLHRSVFKFNLKLTTIHLEGNQLDSLSVRTFSHLSKLDDLNLTDNKCVSKNWKPNAIQSVKDIETSLKLCNENYIETAQNNFDEYSNKLENLESQMSKLTEKLQKSTKETAENSASSHAALEAKFERKFEDFDQKIDAINRNLENYSKSSQDKEILLQKIVESLKVQDKYHEQIMESLNSTLLGMKEKILKLETKNQELERKVEKILFQLSSYFYLGV